MSDCKKTSFVAVNEALTFSHKFHPAIGILTWIDHSMLCNDAIFYGLGIVFYGCTFLNFCYIGAWFGE
jgi:hypothetical protein